MLNAVAGPGVAVAEKLAVALALPSISAVTFWVPDVVPKVQLVDASPSSPLVALVSLSDPPPWWTEKVIPTADTAVPPWSSARTTSGSTSSWPTVSVWVFPDTIDKLVGTCCTVADAVADRPPAVAVSVV